MACGQKDGRLRAHWLACRAAQGVENSGTCEGQEPEGSDPKSQRLGGQVVQKYRTRGAPLPLHKAPRMPKNTSKKPWYKAQRHVCAKARLRNLDKSALCCCAPLDSVCSRFGVVRPDLSCVIVQGQVSSSLFQGLSDRLMCMPLTFCPPTIWVISLDFCRKPSILEADDLLGACYRKAMTQERKFSPKRKFLAGYPCGHPAKNFGQALQIMEKQAFRNGHPALTSMKKLRSEKLRADFPFPNDRNKNVLFEIYVNCPFALFLLLSLLRGAARRFPKGSRT